MYKIVDLMKYFGIDENAIKSGDEVFNVLIDYYKLTDKEKNEINECAQDMFNNDLNEGTAYIGNLTDLINYNILWAAIAHISTKYDLCPCDFKTETRNIKIHVYYQKKQIV